MNRIDQFISRHLPFLLWFIFVLTLSWLLFVVTEAREDLREAELEISELSEEVYDTSETFSFVQTVFYTQEDHFEKIMPRMMELYAIAMQGVVRGGGGAVVRHGSK